MLQAATSGTSKSPNRVKVATEVCMHEVEAITYRGGSLWLTCGSDSLDRLHFYLLNGTSEEEPHPVQIALSIAISMLYQCRRNTHVIENLAWVGDTERTSAVLRWRCLASHWASPIVTVRPHHGKAKPARHHIYYPGHLLRTLPPAPAIPPRSRGTQAPLVTTEKYNAFHRSALYTYREVQRPSPVGPVPPCSPLIKA